MMSECDTLLMIGTSFPYAELLPKEGQARCVEIDIDARDDRHPLSRRRVAGRRREGDVAGADPDAGAARRTAAGGEGIEESVREWWEMHDKRALEDADPMNPQRVVCTSCRSGCPTT